MSIHVFLRHIRMSTATKSDMFDINMLTAVSKMDLAVPCTLLQLHFP